MDSDWPTRWRDDPETPPELRDALRAQAASPPALPPSIASDVGTRLRDASASTISTPAAMGSILVVAATALIAVLLAFPRLSAPGDPNPAGHPGAPTASSRRPEAEARATRTRDRPASVTSPAEQAPTTPSAPAPHTPRIHRAARHASAPARAPRGPEIREDAERDQPPVSLDAVRRRQRVVEEPMAGPEPRPGVLRSRDTMDEATSALDLGSEAALLHRARAALRDDPEAALALTEAHRQRFAHGALEPEREVIAIDALVRLGDRTRAEARAAELDGRHPDGLYRERTRRALDGPRPTP